MMGLEDSDRRVGPRIARSPSDRRGLPVGETSLAGCDWEKDMFGSRTCRRQGRFARWCFVAVSLSVLPFGCGLLVDAGSNDGPPSTLAVFNDPDSEFSTSDVHDVENQIVRFDTQAKTIIWALDGRAFQPGVWEVNGNFLRPGNPFQVRFGNFEGERRAYFTETIPATICDIEVPGEALLIFATDTPVPQ